MTHELNLGQLRKLVVLIQNGKTAEFLKADNSWTTDVSRASHFLDIESAFSHMQKTGLPHLQVFIVPQPNEEQK